MGKEKRKTRHMTPFTAARCRLHLPYPPCHRERRTRKATSFPLPSPPPPRPGRGGLLFRPLLSTPLLHPRPLPVEVGETSSLRPCHWRPNGRSMGRTGPQGGPARHVLPSPRRKKRKKRKRRHCMALPPLRRSFRCFALVRRCHRLPWERRRRRKKKWTCPPLRLPARLLEPPTRISRPLPPPFAVGPRVPHRTPLSCHPPHALCGMPSPACHHKEKERRRRRRSRWCPPSRVNRRFVPLIFVNGAVPKADAPWVAETVRRRRRRRMWGRCGTLWPLQTQRRGRQEHRVAFPAPPPPPPLQCPPVRPLPRSPRPIFYTVPHAS